MPKARDPPREEPDSGNDSAAEVEKVAKQKTYKKKDKVRDNASSGDDEATEDAQGSQDPDHDKENEASEGGGEDEEVYEIEAILDAKMGYFATGRYGYLVRWKGYGPEEDSWVDEPDAEGATDLIEEYWHANPKKQRGRKSGAAATPASKKTSTNRKSLSSRKSSEDLGEALSPEKKTRTKQSPPPRSSASSKKRPRASNASRRKDDSDNDDADKTQDEEVPPAAKRGRTSSSAKVNGSKKNPTSSRKKAASKLAEGSPIETDDLPAGGQPENEYIQDVPHRYRKLEKWDNIVKTISTVEQRGTGGLQIYWDTVDDEKCLTDAKVFAQKCPFKLIDFYEANLKWRLTPEDSSAQ